MDSNINNLLMEFQHDLEKLYGDRLVQLVVFGSQARGDAESGSDIDILVALKGKVHPGEEISRTGKMTTHLSLKYNSVISCVFISIDRFLREQSPMLLNVRREGVRL